MNESDVEWVKHQVVSGGMESFFVGCVFVASALGETVFFIGDFAFSDELHQLMYEKCARHSQRIAEKMHFKAQFLEQIYLIRDLLGVTDDYKKKKTQGNGR